MVYVLRLSSGDCVLADAPNERIARDLADTLGLEQDETVVEIRALPRFAVRLSPTDSGSLEVNSWDDSTLDDILTHEYPLLEEAFRRANSMRFMPAPTPTRAVLEQLKESYEQNTEIIRKGLRQELERYRSPVLSNRKAGGQ